MSLDGPAVCVVVATHNRAARLAALLDGLRAQTVPGGFEVVVADDRSTDATPEVLAAASERGDLSLQVVRAGGRGGVSGARNAGWRAGRAPLVVFTDDDCRPPEGWLAALLEAWGGDPERFVQGAVIPDPGELDRQGPFSRSLRVGALGPFFQTANMAYPRALLERVGGFDEEAFPGPSAEDADLGHRCLEAGARGVFAADAVTHHAVHRLGPLGKLRVATRWGDTLPIYRRHPAMRATLTYRVFFKKTHYLVVRALIGRLLPRRLRPLRFWFYAPIAPAYWERSGTEGHGARWSAPYFLLHDIVETLAIARAAVRHRLPLL